MKTIISSADPIVSICPARFHLFLTLFVKTDRPRRRRAGRMPAL
ncbi:MAG TPA: hypothetical protein VGO90_05295 [Chthoniobacteraceae bacterium]|nr:hypothetical protein [Chthoniobacteraceae bacterium]